ncbi:IS3 family transposase [Streptomyces sp. NPDC051051]|uniref:IS3 family transposase n=1 Tax=Streptomyces sp. NPDC051051 TaxID=3155666 RepID=UPI0034459741
MAAALAAAEMSPVIEPDMIDAAWSLVWRSIRDVADLAHADSTLLEDPLAKTGVAVPTDAGSAGVRVEPSWHAESAAPDFPDTPVQRSTAVVQSQYRDSRVTRQVKAWYGNTCQFCGTMIELPTPLFEYIDGFYNPRRIQKRPGYLSPVEFEERHYADQAAAEPVNLKPRQPALNS